VAARLMRSASLSSPRSRRRPRPCRSFGRSVSELKGLGIVFTLKTLQDGRGRPGIGLVVKRADLREEFRRQHLCPKSRLHFCLVQTWPANVTPCSGTTGRPGLAPAESIRNSLKRRRKLCCRPGFRTGIVALEAAQSGDQTPAQPSAATGTRRTNALLFRISARRDWDHQFCEARLYNWTGVRVAGQRQYHTGTGTIRRQGYQVPFRAS
jgi:hypothetical protein